MVNVKYFGGSVIKYKVGVDDNEVEVSIDVDGGNKFGAVNFTGNADSVALVRSLLSSAYGAFGHGINLESCSPIDLAAALGSMATFKPEILEGEDLVKDWNPGIPDGAVT